MKILHVPFCYAPDPIGGTEVYVEALARHQREQGLDVEVAAPAKSNASYLHQDVTVYRFAVSPTLGLVELYGEGDAAAAVAFESVLQDSRPDIVHLHCLTSGVSLRVLRAAKRFGSRVVFTYHTPTVTCVRGTLLQWGTDICQGALNGAQCTACFLQALGMNSIAARIAASMPRKLAGSVDTAGLTGGLWTALRMRDLVERRHEATRAVLAEADHVVAVCEWVRDLLLRLGLSEKKLTLSRQGLPGAMPISIPRESSDRLRVAFLGRADRVKGLAVLVEAVLDAPDLAMTLDIFAVAQDDSGIRLLSNLRSRCAQDARIRFLPSIPFAQVAATLQRFDLLAVPSQWLETGPIVIYQAFAAGIPVIGSNLGGIAEIVRDGVDGLLVSPHSSTAWSAALRRVVSDRALLTRLTNCVRPPRTMRDAAADMLAVYTAQSDQHPSRLGR